MLTEQNFLDLNNQMCLILVSLQKCHSLKEQTNHGLLRVIKLLFSTIYLQCPTIGIKKITLNYLNKWSYSEL